MSQKLMYWLALALLAAAAQSSTSLAQPLAASDSIELLSGQTLAGSISDPSLTIDSRLGTVQVPLSSILSLASQPPPHVTQTLTTRDGDILIGRVTANSVHLVSTDGSAQDIPIAQIGNLTLGARSSNPAIATTGPSTPGAIVLGLSGDRLAVKMPESIDFQSRWGRLSANAQQVRQIVFSSKDQIAHRMILSDGSSLTGILAAQVLDLKLRNLDASVSAPVGELARLAADDDTAPAPGGRLDMVGGDVLRGALQGTLTLQTQFAQVSVPTDQIDKLAPVPDGGGDIEVTLANGRTLRGSPQDAPLACRLNCGITVSIPAPMITAYAKLAPPSSMSAEADDTGAALPPDMQGQVAQLVDQLQNADMTIVQRAQDQLVMLGIPAIRPLARLRPHQQQRVKSLINNVIARIRAAATQGE